MQPKKRTGPQPFAKANERSYERTIKLRVNEDTHSASELKRTIMESEKERERKMKENGRTYKAIVQRDANILHFTY